MYLDIRPDHANIVHAILEKLVPDRTVWAFGSRVKWLAEEYSDLDLCVIGETPLGFRVLGLLHQAFDKSNLPYKVDIVDWATTSQEFRKIIEKHKIIFREGDNKESENPDWKHTTLGEMINYISRGITPQYTDNLKDSIVVLNQKCIRDFNINFKHSRLSDINKRFVSEEKKLHEFDILVNSTGVGTLGRVAQFLGKLKNITFDSHITVVRPNQSIIDPIYFGYIIKNKQNLIESLAEGSTGQTELSKSALKDLHILYTANKQQQQQIGSTLKSLDDKIALNQKINRTLEEAARALFKSWFVDFDPVKAKMAGKAPFGMDAETAALFPDKLVESELGEIPEGWGVSSLDNIVSVTKGKSYKSEELQSSDTALVTLKSFGRGGGYRLDGLKPYIGSYKPEQEIKPGEIVVAFTDVTQAAEVIGRAALVIRDDRYNKLVASLDTAVIRPINPDLYSNAFLYFLMGQPLFVDHMLSYTSGTTVLHLSKDAIPSYKTTLPTQKISEAFSKIAEPLMQKIAITSEENKTIERTRDYLLPKLLSGEIRIKDAEKLIEEKS